MSIYQDFNDLLKCLNDFKVKYLLVGAHAVGVYTEPRYTKDLDVWVEASPTNAKKIYNALRQFGAPLQGISEEDFSTPRYVYQIGVEPVRIDIITDIEGVVFKEAWKNRKQIDFGSQTVSVIGFNDLCTTKRVAARPQDQLDLNILNRQKKRGYRKRSTPGER